jgi:hypothetical protein
MTAKQRPKHFQYVIPAQAGIHPLGLVGGEKWIPACAGMTPWKTKSRPFLGGFETCQPPFGRSPHGLRP